MRLGAGRRCSVILFAGILAIGLACSKPPNDSQLTSQIQAKFNADSGLHGKPITVRTSGGVVTLAGSVENETEREAAARYAAAIPGIKEVVNNLQTTPAATTPAAEQTTQATTPTPEKALAKPRPSTPLHRAEPISTAMAADVPQPAAAEDAAADNGKPHKSAADANPAPAAPAPPVAKTVTVPAGSTMSIRLLDPIDSEKAQPGQTFRATLDALLQSDGDAAVPSGYDVQGRIVDVKSASKFAGQSLLVLQLDSISVGGKSYGIDVDPYQRQGSNRTRSTEKKVGGGALLGAIIGGIAGGGKGAGIGAAAGGGVGGGVQAASKNQPIHLPSETVLNFTLRSPLTVTMVDKGPSSDRQKLDAPQ